MTILSRWMLLGLLVAAPEEPTIERLSIAASGSRILVSFELTSGLTAETRERIASGLPTGFVYELELMRDRKHWWDRGVEASRLEVVAMFNAVTQEYLLNTKHDGRLIGSRMLRDPAELERAMTQFAPFPAFTVEAPQERTRYLVRVRVDLGPSSILGFIPYQRSTPWVESNKVRIRVAEP